MPPKGGDEGTDSAAKTRTTTTEGSVNQVRTLLSRNNIYIQNRDAEQRGAQLIQKARNIVNGARKSHMTIELAEEMRLLTLTHGTDNELTWLVNVWGVLLNNTRWAKAGDDMDSEEAIEWIEKAWKKDNLKCNWGAPFIPGSIPPLEFSDDTPESLIKDIPRVKNPKPDLTYGLTEDAFTDIQRMVNSSHKARLSTNLDHPGLCVEAKSVEAPLAEAVNQCARAGAAMTFLKRKFISPPNGTSGEEAECIDQNPEAAQGGGYVEQSAVSSAAQNTVFETDEKSFTFSLAIDPHLAHLYVHWVEEVYSGRSKKPTVRYQMSMLYSYDLMDSNAWIRLHHDVDNILDWIVGKHRQEIATSCDRIAQSSSENKKRKL